MDQVIEATRRPTRTRTWSLWLATGVLAAAALLGAVLIIVGDQAEIAGRAWLTLLLVATFAGTVVLDAAVSDGPNRWYLPASISVNASLVAVGLLKIWGGFFQPGDSGHPRVWIGQMILFVTIVVLVRVTLIVTQTYGLRFVRRAKRQASRVIATLALVWLGGTTLSLSVTAALPEAQWPDVWWRFVGASALVSVVLILIPVVLIAAEPRAPRPLPVPHPHGYGYAGQPGSGAANYPPAGWAPPAAPPGPGPGSQQPTG